jgi:sRNA-binding protein
VNQIEDPRRQWRKEQERLLAEYVQEAREKLLEKQDMMTVKQLRLALAQDDVSWRYIKVLYEKGNNF